MTGIILQENSQKVFESMESLQDFYILEGSLILLLAIVLFLYFLFE